jgi:hypothetical protein
MFLPKPEMMNSGFLAMGWLTEIQAPGVGCVSSGLLTSIGAG